MWLKKGVSEGLLKENNITLRELASELDYSEREVSAVLDGREEAGEMLAALLLSAFGAETMEQVVDWEKMRAN